MRKGYLAGSEKHTSGAKARVCLAGFHIRAKALTYRPHPIFTLLPEQVQIK
jgi:hypothetical protein